MKVRVTRTITIDEIPSLADRIVKECKESLQEESFRVKVDTHNIQKTIHSLDTAVANINLVSTKLQDVVNILDGWYQTIYPPSETEEVNEVEDE